MAELQEYEEVRPVRRDEIYVYDDIKNDNKMDNVSSPSWKQYLKMLIMMISVSLMSAVVTYFIVNAQLQQKLNLYEKKFANIEKEKMETENRNNITFSDLQKQIKDSTEQVAITAHPSSGTTLKGIIKFDDVKFSVGINNLSAYRSSGKFVVEKEGLYIISVSINSQTNGADYSINLNGNVISYTRMVYISSRPSSMSHTGTVVIVRQLLLNDSLWVNYPDNYYIEGGVWSKFTIVKIK